MTFGDLASSDEDVLAPSGESGDFKASGAGTVDITARATCRGADGADATCPDGSDWKVTVNVAEAPAPPVQVPASGPCVTAAAARRSLRLPFGSASHDTQPNG